MTTNEKIARIRQLMARDQVQAVIIPSGDPHMSEYFSEHWKTAALFPASPARSGPMSSPKMPADFGWMVDTMYRQKNRLPTASGAVPRL